MPVEISVGPPVLTINQGSTFMVTDLNGEIAAESEQGVFAGDTRFVSYYEVFANGERWVRLTSSATSYYAARIYLTNPIFETEDETDWHPRQSELHTSYTNRDFHRRLIFRLHNSGARPGYANGRITFDVELPPGGTWHTCCDYLLVLGQRVRAPIHDCNLGRTELDELQHEWEERATKLTSANEDVYRLYHQSVEDMGALRLHDHDFGRDVWLPAAGVPWFVTIFGRDSLIVSLQNMLIYPSFARGALQKLAEFQATSMDDYRDAEPGKILHEIRFGELAHFKKVPHTPYYGTADATPLYLIALHEAWKWLGDDSLLREYHNVAMRCLEWIDKYGDLDGDGFQEYRTRSELGYENVGWKDAGDAVVYPDGSQVKQPKALCELQGYVFDAWMRMAVVFDARQAQAEGGRPSHPLRGTVLVRRHRLLRVRPRPGQAARPHDRLERGPLPVEWHREPGARGPCREAAARTGHVERLGDPNPLSGQPGL